MPYAQHDNFHRKRDARQNRSGNVARIHIARVRHKARFHLYGRMLRIRPRVFANECSEFLGIGGVKLSGNCRLAKHVAAPHFKSQIGFEGFPLNLTAFIVVGS